MSDNELFDDDLGLGSDDETPTVEPQAVEASGSESESEDDRELKVLDISVPRHAKLVETESETYQLKMPVFINVDAHPYDPVDLKDTIEHNAKTRNENIKDSKVHKNDLIREKLTNQNTIRWKYSNENDEIIKQSNCHFIEWDDGSVSLKIGNEMFDFKTLPLYDNLLVKSHDDLEILQADTILSRVANLLPTSTGTSTHRQLTNAIKNSQQKDKILNTITDSDPLEIQRLADENERKTLKMKRQLELKRRLQEERLGRASPGLNGKDGYEEASYERFNRTYNEEYDDEDDFIDNDDDEIELEEDEDDLDRAAERLRNVKKLGASKYDDDDEDEEQEDEPAEEEDDESKRKRRRIMDSDDEE